MSHSRFSKPRMRHARLNGIGTSASTTRSAACNSATRGATSAGSIRHDVLGKSNAFTSGFSAKGPLIH